MSPDCCILYAALLSPVTGLLALMSRSLARASSYVTFSFVCRLSKIFPIEDGTDMRRNAAFASFEFAESGRVLRFLVVTCL